MLTRREKEALRKHHDEVADMLIVTFKALAYLVVGFFAFCIIRAL